MKNGLSFNAEMETVVDLLLKKPFDQLVNHIKQIEENLTTLKSNGITIVRLKEYALLVAAKKALLEAIRRYDGQSVPQKTKKPSGNPLSKRTGGSGPAKKGLPRRLSLVYSRP